MTQHTDTGGQAFPQVVPNADGGAMFHYGMTMRDYFAARALLTCNVIDIESDAGLPEQLANWSYRVADAMLKARSA